MGLLGKSFSRAEVAKWTPAERHAVERRIAKEARAASKEAGEAGRGKGKKR